MDELLKNLAEIDALMAAKSDFQKSLALLRALKAGAISLDNVLLTPTGWTVVAQLPVSSQSGEVGESVNEQAEPGAAA